MPKYKICFADSYPGEPGTGSWSNNDYFEEEFTGTINAAIAEAERISREVFQGDYLSWLEQEVQTNRLLMLSGPSGIGKGPALAAIKQFHPEKEFTEAPIIKARESRPKDPRPDETGIWDDPRYFRGSAEILALGEDEDYLVFDCRGFPQALDIRSILDSNTEVMLVEAYHTAVHEIFYQKDDLIEQGLTPLYVFMSPKSAQEDHVRRKDSDYKTEVIDLMRAKLQERAVFMGQDPTDEKIKRDIEARANDGYVQMTSMQIYNKVIHSTAMEGDPLWNRRPDGSFTAKPEGAALETMETLSSLLVPHISYKQVSK